MNAGIFFARKDSIINNFIKYDFDTYKKCLESLMKAKNENNIYYPNKKYFKNLIPISFDYSILEKSQDINAIKLNLPLTDLGNWKEIWKFFKKYKSKNYIKKNTFVRPWGKYINLFVGKGFLLKELIINPNSAISLQKHFFRSERWFINSGRPKITIDKKSFFKTEGDTILVPKGSIHRIQNIYNVPVQIIEVQMGKILKESDIVRFKDIYGRIK